MSEDRSPTRCRPAAASGLRSAESGERRVRRTARLSIPDRRRFGCFTFFIAHRAGHEPRPRMRRDSGVSGVCPYAAVSPITEFLTALLSY